MARIALVHHRFAPGGGMERYLADLVRGFRDAGDEVGVWARDIDPSFARSLGVATQRLRTLPVPRAWRTQVLATAVERLQLQQRHDLVISLARTRGQDLHVCGGTHPGYLAALQLPARWRDRREIAAERAAVESSACTVAHAHGLGAELQHHYGMTDERLRVVYPPLDTDVFRPADPPQRAAAREQFGLQAGLKYWLFPSMGHARKGFDLVLQAFKSLQEQPLRLLVAGRDPGVALPRNARALGYVRDMARLYHAVDGTVLPSRYEPFGLVLAESLQCGTPVITAASAGVAELMQDSDGIRLAQLDGDAVRGALLRLSEAPAIPIPGFAQRHGLTLPEHVAALRDLRVR